MKSLWVFIIIAFVLVILVIVAIVIARKNAVQAAMLAAQNNGMGLAPPQALGLQQPVIESTAQSFVNTVTPIVFTPTGNPVNPVKEVKTSALKIGKT